MAIIDCPNCKKQVSDKAPECQYCHLDLKNLDQAKLKQLRRMNTIKQSQQMMTLSFVAMLLFCGGFLFLYWRDAAPGTFTHTVAVSAITLGFILYIITRVRMILLKRHAK
jgi:hypothetical protein